MVPYYYPIRAKVSWLEAYTAIFKWGHHNSRNAGSETWLRLSLQGDKALLS